MTKREIYKELTEAFSSSITVSSSDKISLANGLLFYIHSYIT